MKSLKDDHASEIDNLNKAADRRNEKLRSDLLHEKKEAIDDLKA